MNRLPETSNIILVHIIASRSMSRHLLWVRYDALYGSIPGCEGLKTAIEVFQSVRR